jgi:hypothetical protein
MHCPFLAVGMRRDDAVGSVGARYVKIAVFKPAFSLIEHIERFGFVLLTAATAFSSKVLASSAGPYWPYAAHGWTYRPERWLNPRCRGSSAYFC